VAVSIIVGKNRFCKKCCCRKQHFRELFRNQVFYDILLKPQFRVLLEIKFFMTSY
jgi:hypothetical protein